MAWIVVSRQARGEWTPHFAAASIALGDGANDRQRADDSCTGTLALMTGGLLWGEGVPSTYNTRVELKVLWRY